MMECLVVLVGVRGCPGGLVVVGEGFVVVEGSIHLQNPPVWVAIEEQFKGTDLQSSKTLD